VIGVRAVSAAFSEPPGEGIADLEGVIITGHARGNRTDTPATDYAKQAFARLPERSPETGLICLSGPSGPMVQAFDTAWRRAPDGRLTGPDFPTRARRIHPFTLLRALGNGVCAGLSMGFGLRGPALNVLDQATAPVWLMPRIAEMLHQCPAVVLVMTDAGGRLEEGTKRRARTGDPSMLEGAICLLLTAEPGLGRLSMAEPDQDSSRMLTPCLTLGLAILESLATGGSPTLITLTDSDGTRAALRWSPT